MTLALAFAGRVVRLHVQGPRSRALVAFLFGRVPRASDEDTPDEVFDVRDTERGIALAVGGVCWFDGPSGEIAGSLLVEEVMHQLMMRSDSGLLLHAAALRLRGQGVLLPGESRSGKSTTAAWLASRGWDYLTDELVFLPLGAAAFQPFSRPIQLRAESRPALSAAWAPGTVLSGTAFDLVGAPAPAREGPGTSTSPLRLIVFPRHQQTGGCQVLPLSRARAGLELMRSLLNARNLPDHGFTHVAQVARSTTDVRLIYSEIRDLNGQLEALLA